MDLDSLTSTGSLVLDSTASANAVNGISLTDNSMALRCSTNGNGQRGIDMTGNSGVGSVTANGNGVSNVFGSPRLVNCIVVGGAQSCP